MCQSLPHICTKSLIDSVPTLCLVCLSHDTTFLLVLPNFPEYGVHIR
nr:MAG TPA: hypothetical protein [Caudoviricetes sp.]